MTGPEHYREAELLFEDARRHRSEPDGQESLAALSLAEAQVHATLALAAATALRDPEGGTLGDEHGAWLRAASSFYRNATGGDPS